MGDELKKYILYNFHKFEILFSDGIINKKPKSAYKSLVKSK